MNHAVQVLEGLYRRSRACFRGLVEKDSDCLEPECPTSLPESPAPPNCGHFLDEFVSVVPGEAVDHDWNGQGHGKSAQDGAEAAADSPKVARRLPAAEPGEHSALLYG